MGDFTAGLQEPVTCPAVLAASRAASVIWKRVLLTSTGTPAGSLTASMRLPDTFAKSKPPTAASKAGRWTCTRGHVAPKTHVATLTGGPMRRSPSPTPSAGPRMSVTGCPKALARTGSSAMRGRVPLVGAVIADTNAPVSLAIVEQTRTNARLRVAHSLATLARGVFRDASP